MHPQIQLLNLPEILQIISSKISPQNSLKTKSCLSQLNPTAHYHLQSSLLNHISIKPSSIASLNIKLARSTSSNSLKFCKSLEIKDEDESIFELSDFTSQNDQWSRDLIKIVERLGKISKRRSRLHSCRYFTSQIGLTAFSFKTQAQDYNPHVLISSLAWKKLAIALSEVLQELSLDLGQDNEKVWKVFQFSDFKNLSKLRLRLNPPEEWAGEELQSTLNSLIGLKEFKLYFFSKGKFDLDKLTLENYHPDLISLDIEFPSIFYQDSRVSEFINRHNSTLKMLSIQSDDDEGSISLLEKLEETTLENLKVMNLPDLYTFDQLKRFLGGLKVLKVGIDLETSMELLDGGTRFTSQISCIQIMLKESPSIQEVIDQMDCLLQLFPESNEIGLVIPPRSNLTQVSSSSTSASSAFSLDSTIASLDTFQLISTLLKSIKDPNQDQRSSLNKLKGLNVDLNNDASTLPDPEMFHFQLKQLFRTYIASESYTCQTKRQSGLTDLKVQYQGFESHFWIQAQTSIDSKTALNCNSLHQSKSYEAQSSFSERNEDQSLYATTIFNHLA